MEDNSIRIPRDMIAPVENYSTEEVAKFMRDVTDAMCNLFEKKDKAYGGSWQQRGILSAHLNLERKMDRVKSQFESGQIFDEDNIENIADTLIDNAVYSLMNLWYHGKKRESVRSFVEEFYLEHRTPEE